ncbi:MAG: hypothetical protein HYX96_05835 [Chloroflexi bacterium]|nr:hypothetical protein [Chloroflexota bacterium]
MTRSSQSGSRAPIGGVILLFLGVVLLLQTLNIIPWAMWGRLWRFWPVVIIIIGLVVLLHHANPWALSGLVLALLFISLGVAVWQYEAARGQRTGTFSAPLNGLNAGEVTIDFSAGSLFLSSLGGTSASLAEAVSREGAVDAALQRQGDDGRLSLKRGDGGPGATDRWEVKLNPKIPFTVIARLAAAEGNIDLSKLRVTELTLDANAGSYTVAMPAVNGRADLDINVGSLILTIPPDLPARIRADINLGSFDIDEDRFPRQGRYYLSPDFDRATERLEVEISSNLSKVEIR